MGVLVEAAERMACEAHAAQRRKWTDRPYTDHLRRVASRVAAYPGSTPEMVAAAWLHDAVEDTGLTAAGIEGALGPAVAALVVELTNPSKGRKDLPRKDRKAMDRAHLAAVSHAAKIIKMLDRIDNLSDCAAAPRTFRGLYAMESALLADAVGDADPRLESELRAAAARYDPAAREGEAC
jgi:(p)ppGpp synthase/HD superfamily hydrolase